MNTQPVHGTKNRPRHVVEVDLTAVGLVATTDSLGSRASAAPALLGWRYSVAILQRLAATGPQPRGLGSAAELGVRPNHAGTALRNHITRTATHLHDAGHIGLAALLDALLITREGLISIAHGAPHLQLKELA